MALLSFYDIPSDLLKPAICRLLSRELSEPQLSEFEPHVPRKLRRLLMGSPYNLLRRKYGKNWSENIDKDKYQMSVDVHQFSPEELTVKVADNCVTIEGKHEEKSDENNYSSQSFYKKFTLPKGHDMDRIQSKLTPEGILTITAPKEQEAPSKDREIPITLVKEDISTTNKCLENENLETAKDK